MLSRIHSGAYAGLWVKFRDCHQCHFRRIAAGLYGCLIHARADGAQSVGNGV
jgi:phenolic acid decarboxylase